MKKFNYSKNYSYTDVLAVLNKAQYYKLDKAYTVFSDLKDIMNYLCHVYSYFKTKINTSKVNLPNSVDDVLDFYLNDDLITIKLYKDWSYKDYNTCQINGNYILINISKDMIDEFYNGNPNSKLSTKSSKLQKQADKVDQYFSLKSEISNLEKQLNNKKKKLESVLKLLNDYSIQENDDQLSNKLLELKDEFEKESKSLFNEYLSKINFK